MKCEKIIYIPQDFDANEILDFLLDDLMKIPKQ